MQPINTKPDNLRMIGNGVLVNTERLLFADFASDEDFQSRCVTLRFDNDRELRVTLAADVSLDQLFQSGQKS